MTYFIVFYSCTMGKTVIFTDKNLCYDVSCMVISGYYGYVNIAEPPV